MFAQLVRAQLANDPRAESLAIQATFPLRLAAGRQHSEIPAHMRIMRAVAFGVTGCWHWRGATNRFGYGRFSFNGRGQMAHRVSYETFVSPIPKGMSVLHKCDNPSCVNPDHLFLGTYSDNRRDCQAKGRWKMRNVRRGFAHHSTRVTPALLEKMRQLRDGGMSYARIAEAMCISTMAVWHALATGRYGEKQ